MIVLENELETVALAEAFANNAKSGDIIGLSGSLGAGKSSFARAFINARCEVDDVPSPTFTLLQIYEENSINNNTKGSIWHLDLYRINDVSEVYELGLPEAIGHDLLIIEWPERLRSDFLGDWLNLRLDFSKNPDARIATLNDYGPRSKILRDILISQISTV